MKIPSILRVMPLANWLALIALLALIIVGFAYCGERDRAREAENARDFVEGRTLSAGDAIQAIDELNERGQATQAEVQDAQEAIRQAPISERSRIARYELCRLQHRPDCDRLLDVS